MKEGRKVMAAGDVQRDVLLKVQFLGLRFPKRREIRDESNS